MLAIKLQDHDLACLHAVKEYVDKHVTDAFTLEYLAHKFGINEHKLKNGFKQVYRKTVFAYLREERLRKAKDLLETS